MAGRIEAPEVKWLGEHEAAATCAAGGQGLAPSRQRILPGSSPGARCPERNEAGFSPASSKRPLARLATEPVRVSARAAGLKPLVLRITHARPARKERNERHG